MKLNQLFDNEHRRDGRRTNTEIAELAADIATHPEHYSRAEQDLASLVVRLLLRSAAE